MKAKNDTEFYVALPDGHDDRNIAQLIRWALRDFDRAEMNNVVIDEFYLLQPMSSAAKPMVYVDYSIGSRRPENVKTKISINYLSPSETWKFLGGFIAQIDNDSDGEDGIALLNATADAIEKLGDLTVLDLVYHDSIDKHARSRPYVRVYFVKG